MKIKNTLYYLSAFAIIAILFTGCAKDGATGPAGANGANGATGPTGPLSTGNLSGFVKKFDQYGSPVQTGLAGIAVTFTGSSTLSTTTDSTGKYTFSNIATCFYSLSVTDSLYGPLIVSSQQFVGGSSAWHANLNIGAIPNFSVASMAFVDTVLNLTDSTIEINGTLSTTDGQARAVIVYIGSTISTNSSPANYQTYYTVNSKAGTNTFKLAIPLQDLYDLGYLPTQTIYFAGYGISSTTASAYEDFATGRTVITDVSPVAFPASHMIQ